MAVFHRRITTAFVLLLLGRVRVQNIVSREGPHTGWPLNAPTLRTENGKVTEHASDGGNKFRRQLQQDDDDTECRPNLKAAYYDADRAVWNVNDTALATEGLDAVMHCVRDNDTVVLSGTTPSLTITKTVEIKHSITITANADANRRLDGTIRPAVRKTELTCPGSSSVFDITAPRVILANLVIRDCNMTKDSKSPVQIRVVSSITLKYVEFRDNVHHSDLPSALTFETRTGSSLILEDVSFVRNAGGSSVAYLPETVKMTDVRSFNNNGTSAVFDARAADVSISRLGALDNNVTVVSIQDGRLSLTDSNFTNNKKSGGGSALSITEHSVANVTDTRFEYNTATDGGALFVTNSTIDITRSVFNKQEARNEGGACFFKGTIARLSKCNFTENKSDNDGGSIRVEGGSLSCWKCQFRQNVARNAGGCLKMDQSKTTTLEESDFVQNEATFGSVFRSEDSDSMTISRCVFEYNVGKNTGGVCYFDANAFTIENCIFRGNTAGYGGAIYAQHSKKGSKILNTSFEKNKADLLGGACHTDFGDLAFLNVTLTGNRASLGGAFYFLSITVRASELLFRENAASEGGAFVALNSQIDISPSAASDSKPASFGMKAARNVADNGGGAVHVDNTTISISDAEFTDCSAVEGGAVRAVGKEYRVNVSNSTFLNNHAEESGGSVYARSIDHGTAYLNFKNVTFRGSESLQSGGACYLSFVDANFEDCRFSECTSFYGGALLLRKGSSVEYSVKLAHSTIAQCRANQTGGGIYASTGAHVILQSTDVRANQAPNGPGGGMTVTDASLWLSDVIISENTAEEGGGLALLDGAEADIRRSKILRNSADQAGGISMQNIEKAFVHDTDVKLNEANGKGGGMMLEESTCKARHARITGNKAKKDGGGLVIDQSSSALFEECHFEDNEALTNGGGISVKSGADKKEISAQLNGCEFRRNKASFGAGIHFVKKGAEDTDLPKEQLAKLGGVVLINTRFNESNVARNGSAVHSNLGSFITVLCADSMPMPVNGAFLDQEDLKKLRKSDHDEEKCRKNITGAEDEAAFSTYVRRIKLEGDGLTLLDSNVYQLSKIVSGEELRQIIVTLLDEYGHFPAFSSGNDLRPKLTGDLVGGVFSASLLENDSYSFSGIRTNLEEPGQYNLTISFSDDDKLESMTILVEVRQCHIGEMKKKDGVSCESCGDGWHNFFPNKEACAPCPLHANCTGNFVFPERGYWQYSPCDNRTVQCLNPEACHGKNLSNPAFSHSAHSERLNRFTETLEKECPDKTERITFIELQCSEGHNGTLCGECTDGYGLTSVYKCVTCLPKSVLVLLLLLAAGWVYLVVAIAIRGNYVRSPKLLQDLISKRKGQNCTQTFDRPSVSSAPSRRRRARRESLSFTKPLNLSRADSAQEQLDEQNARDALLAKWKVCEIVKILVNFLQAISVAVLINVEWKRYVLDVFRASDLASGASVEAVSNAVYCLSAHSTSHPSVTGVFVVIFGPLLIVLTFAIFYWATVLGGQNDARTAAKRFGLSFFAVLYFNYSNITRQGLNVFLCVAVPDSEFDDTQNFANTENVNNTVKAKYVWAKDTSLECKDDQHRTLMAVATLFIAFFSLGFPIACSFLHYSYHQLNLDPSGNLYDVLGFMFRSYRSKYRYWESVIMLRKACLSLVAVFSYRLGGTTQGMMATSVLVLCLFLHTMCRPFREEFRSLNNYESYSLIVSCMTYLLAGFFVEGRASEWARILLSVCLVVLIVGFVLLMLYGLLKNVLWFFEADLVSANIDCFGFSGFEVARRWVANRMGSSDNKKDEDANISVAMSNMA